MIDDGERLKACKLLIIEDDTLNATILRQHLQNAGYKNLSFAENGEQGLKMTREIIPDLVLLDMMMPQMNGFEYCKAMQSDTALANIPIIVQTALENASDKLRAFSAGSSDYITKPAHAPELLARIKVHLSNKLLREKILAQQQQMEAELNAAKLMQENLMPSQQQLESMEQLYKLHIAKYFETSSIMGGDFWGIFALSETRLAVYMLDFSGHGVTAALNVFRIHTLMQELSANSPNPGDFLTGLNRRLYPLIERNSFATMFYGIIDTEANSLEYAAAAPPPILLLRPQATHREWLATCGYPLGATQSATYKTIYTPFAPGDALVICSDCLFETTNKNGETLSEDIIAACSENALAEAAEAPAAHIVAQLLSTLRQHNSSAISDDLTLNVYCRK
jgi:sigma-B regulation protein RsbU (phosphoserine phosphatase)